MGGFDSGQVVHISGGGDTASLWGKSSNARSFDDAGRV